jgi:multidrug efflux pump subunit AcrA (membrane-fusion protein)
MEISVPEADLDVVEVGQPVVLKVRAFPDREFHATIDAISVAVSLDEDSGKRVVHAVAHVTNPDLLLRDQMTGYAEIRCGRRSGLAQMGRRLLQWVRVRFVI